MVSMPTDPKKALWFSIERKRLSVEQWATTRIHTALKESVQGVIDNMEQFGVQDALNDLRSEISEAPMVEAYQDVYERIGVAFARQSFNAFKSRKDDQAVEDEWVRFMREFAVVEAGQRIAGVNDTTLKRIRAVLENGVKEGLGIEEIARNMQESTAIHRVRARAIARTEIVSASNKGSLLGAQSTGLQLKKEWISTRDRRTRPDHLDADGQIVDFNEKFNVGGEEAEYPGDPSLSAANSINCRCAVASIPYD